MAVSTNLFHDVTLFVGERSIEAHQEVLRKASGYFAKAFDKYNSRGKKLVLPMLEVKVSYEDLLDVIKYIYTGEFSVDRKDSSQLMILFHLKFKIRVERPNELGTYVFQVHSSCTVLKLKSNIRQLKGIEPEQQRLFFAGKQLEDERTLGDCKIVAGSVLQLWLKF